MGVVQNKIEIGFLAEANARVMTSVKKISNDLTPEVITLTPYDDSITIQEQCFRVAAFAEIRSAVGKHTILCRI